MLSLTISRIFSSLKLFESILYLSSEELIFFPKTIIKKYSIPLLIISRFNILQRLDALANLYSIELSSKTICILQTPKKQRGLHLKFNNALNFL